MPGRLSPVAPWVPTHMGEERGQRARDVFTDQDDDDDDDVRPPSPKRRREHYRTRPLFDKTSRNEDDLSIDHMRNHDKARPSSPVIQKHPLTETMERKYAGLRLFLHSQTGQKLNKEQETLVTDAGKRVNTKSDNHSAITNQAQELSELLANLRVDIVISAPDGKQKTSSFLAAQVLSNYEERQSRRSEKLVELLKSWRVAQAEIDELSVTIRDRLGLEEAAANETNGISSAAHGGWLKKEYADLGARSKQVVDEMVASEKEFQEKLEDEAGSIAESILNK